MTSSRWAKIFSPFDALEGFDERIAEKEVLYQTQRELCEDDQGELNRRLSIIHNLTWNGRMARANKVMINVLYYSPCEDINHFAFGRAGRYETVSGMVLKAEMNELLLLTEDGLEARISFNDIREITSESDIFETEWEYQ